MKTPPNSIEAEQSLICSMLINPETIDNITGLIQPSAFYSSKTRCVYQHICDLRVDGQPVDLITLSNAMEESGDLSKVGVVYLSELTDTVPQSVNAPYHAEIIKQKAIKRKLISLSLDLQNECYDDHKPTLEILDKIQKDIVSIDYNNVSKNSTTLKTGVSENIEYLEKLQKNNKEISGVSTGLRAIDNMTFGLQPTNFIVLAARPAMGKSALMMNILSNIVKRGDSGAVFSYEMPRQELINRMLSEKSKLNSARFRTGGFSKQEWKKIMDSASQLYNQNLFINDNSDMSILDVRRESRRLRTEHDIKIVFIDYLQLMGRYGGKREQVVAEISRECKKMAKELSIPVVALSQLNRSCESRDDKRPMLSDLRESGAIEQDADIVMFLYRGEIYYKDDDELKGVAELNFAKNRHGIVGSVPLKFTPELTLFTDTY